MRQSFFSVIIPAHNEENYIANTLSHLLALDYPKDLFEVIVIENGSTDKTLEAAKKYESGNIFIYSNSGKGVSKARNMGIERLNKQSEWVIFLDADTLLYKNFLSDCNGFLQKDLWLDYVVGVTSMKPLPATRKARIFFWFYDLFRWVFKAPLTIMIAKTKMLEKIRFDETLDANEDMVFVKKMKRQGKAFFLWTDEAATSIRRLEKLGWLQVFIYWFFVQMSPLKIKRRFIYKVIR